LGTNLGEKETNILNALEEIKRRIGEITSLSSFYASEPVGFESENLFLNAVCCVQTQLSPYEVLSATQDIERNLGRTQKSINREYHDRTMDIDILLYDNLCINTPELTIPHPLMKDRDFVMTPLKEILDSQSLSDLEKRLH
jgi:2-amino-4-hydroxy-6-hydroxymethyldihydropteridine diphosphokinase